MFTFQQIKEAHSKVKTGADFPRYIGELRSLGLKRYEFLVATGDTVYYDGDSNTVRSGIQWKAREIAAHSSPDTLRQTIAIHQKGETDFLSFCLQAAEAGVEKWVIDTEKMVCAYYDPAGSEMVVEPIPEESYA